MADFAQAIEWLKEGKKVRLSILSGQQYIHLDNGYVKWENGAILELTNFHITSSGWQIYGEPKYELVWEEGRKYKLRNSECFHLLSVSPFINEAEDTDSQLFGLHSSKDDISDCYLTKNGKYNLDNTPHKCDIIGYWED